MTDIQLFKREHGQDFDMPAEILALVKTGELIDISWHNDAMPSFQHIDAQSNDRDLRLFVDYLKPEDRECGSECKRFAVDDEGLILATDDINEAIEALRRAANNERFVMVIGSICERYPDIPVALSESQDIVLWDRKHKRPVMTIHREYAQAICLELNTSAETMPFTNVEKWFNSVGDEALASEGIE